MRGGEPFSGAGNLGTELDTARSQLPDNLERLTAYTSMDVLSWPVSLCIHSALRFIHGPYTLFEFRGHYESLRHGIVRLNDQLRVVCEGAL